MGNRHIHRALVRALVAAGIAVASSAAPAADQAMIDARVKIFGPENVDATTGALKKDKVVFSWLGHISGAVSLMGRVIMLDTYIPRLEVTPGRTPFVIKDLVDMKPEAVFIGHGHGDHADNAVFIAAKTGATIYMTPEACSTAQTALARMKADPFMQADAFFAIAQATTVTCVPITTAGSTPGTQVIRINQLEPLVCINAFRALHSVSVPADPDWGAVPVVDTPDPRDPTLFPPGVSLTPPANPGESPAGPAGPAAGQWARGCRRIELPLHAAQRLQLHAPLQQLGRCDEGRAGKQLAERDPRRRPTSARPDPQPAEHRSELRDPVVRQYGQQRLARCGVLGAGAEAEDHDDRPRADRRRAAVLLRIPEPSPADGAAEECVAWIPRSQWPIVRNHTDPTDILKPEVYSTGDPYWLNPEKAPKITRFCS
jgi:hypothetical protein